MPHGVVVVELDETFGAPLRPDRPNLYVDIAHGDAAVHVAQLQTGSAGPLDIRGHVGRARPDLYERYPPTTRRDARRQRRALVCRLIRQYHLVHGHLRYRVYVVELDAGHVRADPQRGWVYVGMSSKSPEQRFAEHRSGARNARGRLYNTKVRDHGVRLLPRYYESRPPACSPAEGRQREREVAVHLHRKGFVVVSDALPTELR